MAKETALSPLFLGTDFSYVFHVKNEAEDTSIEITGQALSFMVKRDPLEEDDAALLSKSATIAGTFNATPSVNTQRATVTIADTDTATLAPLDTAYWELKRTDDGFETVYAYGTVELKRGVHR